MKVYYLAPNLWLAAWCVMCLGQTSLRSQSTQPSTPFNEKTHQVRVGAQGGNIDFGRQILGAHVVIEALLINEENAAIKIVKVQPSCGCIAPDLKVTAIPPHGQATIALTVDGTDRNGPYSGTVLVELESGGKRSHRLISLSGFFYAQDNELVVQPESLNLTNVGVGRKFSQVFQIFYGGDNARSGYRIRSSADWLRMDGVYAGEPKDESAWRATIQIPENARELTTQLEVTGLTGEPILFIPVQIKVAPLVAVTPLSLLLSEGTLPEIYKVRIRSNHIGALAGYSVQGNRIGVLECTSVRTPNDEVEVSLKIEGRQRGFVEDIVNLQFDSLNEAIPIPVVGWIIK